MLPWGLTRNRVALLLPCSLAVPPAHLCAVLQIMMWAIEHADAIYRAAEAQASPRTTEAVLAHLQSQPEPALPPQQPSRVVSH